MLNGMEKTVIFVFGLYMFFGFISELVYVYKGQWNTDSRCILYDDDYFREARSPPRPRFIEWPLTRYIDDDNSIFRDPRYRAVLPFMTEDIDEIRRILTVLAES